MSTPPSRPPVIGAGVTRQKAWTCVAVNLLVFPGIGTLMAGRRKSGYGQAILTLIGLLILMWFVTAFLIRMVDAFGGAQERNALSDFVQQNGWIGVVAVAVCMAGWCWALLTSLELLRGTRRQ